MNKFLPDSTQYASDRPIPLVELPDGFRDNSWVNDMCPSMINEEKGLIVWVDYLDPKDRDMGEDGRLFTLQTYEEGEHGEQLISTNSWSEVQDYIENYGQMKPIQMNVKIEVDYTLTVRALDLDDAKDRAEAYVQDNMKTIWDSHYKNISASKA